MIWTTIPQYSFIYPGIILLQSNVISASSFSISKILSHFRKTQNKFMTRPSMMLFLLAMLEHDITFFVWQNNDRYGLWDGLAIGHPQYSNLSPSFRPTLGTISIVFERIYKIFSAPAKIAHPQFQSRDLKVLSGSSCGEYFMSHIHQQNAVPSASVFNTYTTLSANSKCLSMFMT